MDNPLDFQVYTANSMCIEYKNRGEISLRTSTEKTCTFCASKAIIP